MIKGGIQFFSVKLKQGLKNKYCINVQPIMHCNVNWGCENRQNGAKITK